MHFLDFFHRAIISTPWLRLMIADITLHITLIDHIEEGETGVILMLRTDSAVEWTPSSDRSEIYFREIRILQVGVTLSEIVEIGRDKSEGFTTVRTPFPEVHLLSLRHEVSGDESRSILTEMTE